MQDIDLVRESAEGGHVDAQVLLGKAYAQGDGVEQDDGLAAEWWQKAAEQGDAEAQGLLGIAYALGRGVPQDAVLGFALLEVASTRGEWPPGIERFAEGLSPAEQAEAHRIAASWRPGDLFAREVGADERPPAQDTQTATPAGRPQAQASAFEPGCLYWFGCLGSALVALCILGLSVLWSVTTPPGPERASGEQASGWIFLGLVALLFPAWGVSGEGGRRTARFARWLARAAGRLYGVVFALLLVYLVLGLLNSAFYAIDLKTLVWVVIVLLVIGRFDKRRQGRDADDPNPRA